MNFHRSVFETNNFHLVIVLNFLKTNLWLNSQSYWSYIHFNLCFSVSEIIQENIYIYPLIHNDVSILTTNDKAIGVLTIAIMWLTLKSQRTVPWILLYTAVFTNTIVLYYIKILKFESSPTSEIRMEVHIEHDWMTMLIFTAFAYHSPAYVFSIVFLWCIGS